MEAINIGSFGRIPAGDDKPDQGGRLLQGQQHCLEDDPNADVI